MLLVLSSFGTAFAQVRHLRPDTLASCGITKEFVKSLADPRENRARKAKFEAASAKAITVDCGRFRLRFEDEALGNGIGFNDPVRGLSYQQCACDVVNYIQSIYDIPAGDGSPIEIVFEQSWHPTANPLPPGMNAGTLAVGGSLYTTPPVLANTPGFYGGNVFEHYTTGVDPDPVNIDGTITVNFTFFYRNCNDPRNCGLYDLKSILLHEFTHAMGWLSSLEETSAFLPQSSWAPDMYTKYDQYFLHFGNIQTPSLTHVVNATNPAAPYIDPSIPPHALTDERLWLTGIGEDNATNNQNCPINALPHVLTNSDPPNTISHFSDYQDSFDNTAHYAPGFTPDYVMGPYFAQNQVRDVYSLQELRAMNTMGYSFTTGFLASSTINPSAANAVIVANRHPYTTKVIFDNSWFLFSSSYGRSEIDLDATTPPTATISNCDSVTITLANDPLLFDADGDPIRIFPGSLYNIRGCGIGGNNHDALTVTSTPGGDVIKYKPRNNFIGRAQFGFHLYDGKERGAFMVYTVDVTGCNTCPANMVVNWNFEEGMEVKTGTHLNVENSGLTNYRDMKYMGDADVILPDGIPFSNYNTSVVKGSMDCDINLGYFGWFYQSFTPGNAPLAVDAGSRYYTINESNNYFRLCSPAQNCTRYEVEFDYNSTAAASVNLGFTNSPQPQIAPLPLIASMPVTLPSTGGVWQHFILKMNYCSATASDFFAITNAAYTSFHIDNLNVHVDLAPPVFAVAVTSSATSVCAGTSVTLSSNVSNPLCMPVTYSWSPGGATTSSISPVVSSTTAYTLTVNDGCSSVSSAPVTVTANPAPTVTLGSFPSVCSGSAPYALTGGSPAGGTYSGAGVSGGIFTPPVVTVVTMHTITYTYTNPVTGCTGTATSYITVKPLPVVTFAPLANVCSGSAAFTLTGGSPSGGTYSGTGVSGNIFTPPVVTTATTYTITYSYTSSGCTGTATQTITVNPVPAVTFGALASVCSGGAPVTLTTGSPSGGTYSGTGVSGNIFTPPVVTTSTTYTLSYSYTNPTTGCSKNVTQTITVNPLPSVSFGAIANACSGMPVTLTTGSPAGGVYSGTGVAGNVFTPPVVTTATAYTLTYTYTNPTTGCSKSATQNVTVNPAPAVSFTSIANVCSGSAAMTLTSGSPAGGTYSGPFVSGGMFTPPTVSVSTTYTLTYSYTNPSTGCVGTATQTITVDVCAPPCTGCAATLDALAPGGILSTTPSAVQTLCLQNNITVTGNVVLAWCEIRISPGVTITVNPGATLILAGTHLYACTNMWKGIVVKPGGSVKTQSYTLFSNTKSTLIEDAYVAIDVQPGSTLTSNLLLIENTTFNRNQVGIRIDTYDPLLATYPFTISNSVFTSRALAFTPGSLNWPATNAVKATYTVTNPLQTPYINDATYPDAVTAAYLKPPFVPGTTKPSAGIYLKGVGKTTLGPPVSAPTPTYYEIKIGVTGAANYNVFDNLAIGVDALNSNFTCINNVFQRTFAKKASAAINAVAEETFNGRLQALPATGTTEINKFYDCTISIRATNYFEVNARYCDVRSLQNYSTQYGIVHRGQNGFIINTNRYQAINLSNNTMSNIEYGISVTGNMGYYSVGTFTSGLGQYSGKIDVNENTMQPYIPGSPLANTYVDKAIVVDNVTGSTHYINISQVVNTNKNKLANVYRGIACSNWQKKSIVSNDNIITLLNLTPTALQYGISHSNSMPTTAFGNQIKSNDITGFGIGDANVVGITTQLCNNQVVQCNITRNITKGISFSGNEMPTIFHNNTFDNSGSNRHKYAYVLDNNGIIGMQGNTGSPSDNRWLGTWTSGVNYKTATMNGSVAWNGSTGSRIWVRTPTDYNPTGAGYNINIGGGDSYNFAGAINTTTGTIYLGCPATPTTPTPTSFSEWVKMMEDIANGAVPYSVNSSATRIIDKNQLYRVLRYDPDYMATSVDLQNFYGTSRSMYRGQFMSIEEDLIEDDFSSAQAIIARLATGSGVETNYKNLYNTYIKQQTDTLVSSDSTLLYRIANGCPFTDGAIVYQARSLYCAVFDINKTFEDRCTYLSDRSVAAAENGHSFDADLYPNPSTGQVFINPKGLNNEEVQVVVKDLSGKTIFAEALQLSNGISSFKLDNISNGVYFVSIINTKNQETIVKKLVIHK